MWDSERIAVLKRWLVCKNTYNVYIYNIIICVLHFGMVPHIPNYPGMVIVASRESQEAPLQLLVGRPLLGADIAAGRWETHGKNMGETWRNIEKHYDYIWLLHVTTRKTSRSVVLLGLNSWPIRECGPNICATDNDWNLWIDQNRSECNENVWKCLNKIFYCQVSGPSARSLPSVVAVRQLPRESTTQSRNTIYHDEIKWYVEVKSRKKNDKNNGTIGLFSTILSSYWHQDFVSFLWYK